MTKLTIRQIIELEKSEIKCERPVFIVIPRQIINCDWYSFEHAFDLFLHFLLTMSVKRVCNKEITIEKGVCFTTVHDLKYDTGMTEKQIRKAIRTLERYHKISVSKYNGFLIVKVLDYSQYVRHGYSQEKNGQANQ